MVLSVFYIMQASTQGSHDAVLRLRVISRVFCDLCDQMQVNAAWQPFCALREICLTQRMRES